MGQLPKNQKFNSSLILNATMFNVWFNYLQIMALSIFKWEGLPNGISPIFLEKTLFREGRAVFIKDPTLGYMALRMVKSGEWNVYEEAVRIKAFSYGYQADFAKDEVVIIRNNLIEVATKDMIELYAQRLTDIDMTISANLYQQKHPTIIQCDENERLSIENLLMKVEGNQPFILGTKSLDMDRFKTFNIDAPFIADKLQEMKATILDEYNTRLGLNNANTDKKERMIVDEVNANNEVIGMNYLTMLSTRQDAVDQINKKFGLNIKVSLRVKTEEGVDDGTLHDKPEESDRK